MKILKLTAENVKKITVVEITPDGNLVQITGKNGQGKTSVLDSIMWALEGGDTIQAVPLRKGTKSGHVNLTLGDGREVKLLVERRFTEHGSSLTVKSPEGLKFPSPQKLLDDLLGTLSFDPLGFMRIKPREQFDVLRELVTLGIDLESMALADKADYEKRTAFNRNAKALQAQADAIRIPEGLPDEPLSENDIFDTMQQAADFNKDIEVRRTNRVQLNAGIEARRTQAKVLMDRAGEMFKEAQALLDAAQVDSDRLTKAGALPEPVDVTEVRAQLDNVRLVNGGIKLRAEQQALQRQAGEATAEAEARTEAMRIRAETREEALAKADMPIPGLTFGEGVVFYNGLPLDQASDAEQLMVSTGIAAALNPKLRVIRIRDGSLLDNDALKRLAKFADDRDYQIWLEKVGEGDVGIIMEDGHVRQSTSQAAE